MTEAEVHEMIGRRIYQRRRFLGMTQTVLGHRCGITFQQVHKHETGEIAMPAARLLIFANALGVKIDYFVDEGAEIAMPLRRVR
jgi:transcriptional regulator with XRE-family HTH domain